MKIKLIHVQLGRTENIDVGASSTIAQLRSLVAARLNTQPENFVLSFRAVERALGGTLQAAGVLEGGTIRVQTLNIRKKLLQDLRQPHPQSV